MKIDLKTVLEGLDFQADEVMASLGFDNYEAVAHTVRDWHDKNNESAPETMRMILTHETLNDKEKVAGIFLLGSIISARVLGAQHGEKVAQDMFNEIKERLMKGISHE